MKVLMINGSPRKGSNCGIALGEMKKIFKEAGIEYTEVVIGNENIRLHCLPLLQKHWEMRI